MKRLKGDAGGKRKGIEVDELSGGPRKGSIPRRGRQGEGCRSRENNHRRRAPILSRGDY